MSRGDKVSGGKKIAEGSEVITISNSGTSNTESIVLKDATESMDDVRGIKFKVKNGQLKLAGIVILAEPKAATSTGICTNAPVAIATCTCSGITPCQHNNDGSCSIQALLFFGCSTGTTDCRTACGDLTEINV